MSVSSLVSFFLHMALLLACALIVYDPGEGIPSGEEVQIGRLPRVPLNPSPAEKLDPTAVKPPAEDEQLSEEILDVTPVESIGGGETIATVVLDFAPGGAGYGIGDLSRPAGGPGDEVKFMGTVATGRRFCIVADTSGSMHGPKLDYVKEEILETVASMKATARFQVVFFCSRAIPYPEPDWLRPRKEYDELGDWLAKRYASGGTEPMTAFRVAFALQPPPDAIFFMTDGLFPTSVVREVAELQRTTRKQVVIHTICFMDDVAEPWMREIARNSGGTYRYVAAF
jgi:hypothetical protein